MNDSYDFDACLTRWLDKHPDERVDEMLYAEDNGQELSEKQKDWLYSLACKGGYKGEEYPNG